MAAKPNSHYPTKYLVQGAEAVTGKVDTAQFRPAIAQAGEHDGDHIATLPLMPTYVPMPFHLDIDGLSIEAYRAWREFVKA